MILSIFVGRAGAENLEAGMVKAALVLNFAKFTTWPEDAFATPQADIALWVLGDAAVQQAFEKINGAAIGARKIRVRSMPKASANDPCHILFVDGNVDRSVLTEAFSIVRDRPVLSIGNWPDFIELGGIINIFNKDGRFHFEIKPAAARQRGLQISSRLLKLAIVLGD